MSIRTLPLAPQLPPCDHVPEPYDGPPKEEVLALRRQYLTPGLITYYRDPLLVVEGHMQYLWDERGTRYLDAFAGIVTVSVGHCHPYVVEKVRAQVGKLQHTTTIYLHPTIGVFGKKLADHMVAEAEGEPTPETEPDDEENAGGNPKDPTVSAGYTYLGQFIDHDLTFDPASSLEKQNDPDALVDFRTPRFDLDNVYGRGPDDQPYLYQNDGIRLLLGRPLTGNRL